MPLMEGIMLASEIKREKSKTVVIMMSGDRKKMTRAKSVGDRFLLKPFGLMVLHNGLGLPVPAREKLRWNDGELPTPSLESG